MMLFSPTLPAESRIPAVRAATESLIAALRNPDLDALAHQILLLEEAGEELRALGVSGNREYRFELQELKVNLRRAARLIDSGIELSNGWARLLGTVSAGYESHGQPIPLSPLARISVQG